VTQDTENTLQWKYERNHYSAASKPADCGYKFKHKRRRTMMVAKEELSELVRRVVSFIITLVILGIINAIVVRLPAMDIEVYDTITVAYIASMVISVIIVAIVVIFGKDIAVRVERIIPEFPELNPIIYNIAILAAIIIAYRAFEGLFIPLLDESNIMWLYPVVFLCAAILPIYRLTAVLFTS
jgi:hypothetical protein